MRNVLKYCIFLVVLFLNINQIKAQSTLSGQIYYFNDSLIPLDVTRVYLKNATGFNVDSTYTDAEGNYEFENLTQGVYFVVPNCTKPWGGVNATDALAVMQHFTGMYLLTGLNLMAADVNDSHSVNSIDAMQIMRRFTGLQSSFAAGDWVFEKDSIQLDGVQAFVKDIKALCFGDVNRSYFPPVSSCPPVYYGGHLYESVLIGNQCWMKENLNIGTMVTDNSTGTAHSHCSNNGIIEKYCYNNDPAMCQIWGGLYDWDEMMAYSTTPGVQGICPQGWHIPTDADFCTLTTFLDNSTSCSAWAYSGTNAAGMMKESGLTHWNSPNTGADNQSGFTAFAPGYRFPTGYQNGLKTGIYLWASSEYSSTQGITRNLGMYNANISRYHYVKNYGFSVRCLKNQ